MKLHFPHGDHADVDLQAGTYTVGSSANADIRVENKGLGDIHATLSVVDDECEVKIDNEASLISVNGKLVKGNKEVREGDLLIAAQVHMKMLSSTASEEEEADDSRTRVRMALPKFILRGVSGAYFGKTYPLRGSTILGRHSECHICVNADGISRKHAQIDAEVDGLVVSDLGSSNGTFVNGKKIDKVELKVGDEVKLDNIRFLVQTPGMSDPALDNTAKKSTPKKPIETSDNTNVKAGGGGAMKWVVTLLLLGGAVAVAWKMGYLKGIID